MEFVNELTTYKEKKYGLISLHKLPVGKTARVKNLTNKGLSRRRLLDLGLIPDSIVKTERLSPSGNPIAYNIKGSVMALRKEETKYVTVEILD
ncbi:FeoA family protein [Caldisalinibacter kiritimatiensis]|uniref:FeoA n=1 Tax=Caldisalinibacter kiritimatiensis TaxID=1304284 RepID=R1CFH5_9FIRM|nr:FeoA family protein [Caldisalinibacter kiritimatiensis]EOD01045.1 FeoA [Caldisalinibacter kiritimatiensis]